MAKVVAPITAKVETVGKIRDGEFGQYRPVLFIDQAIADPEAAKIWKSLTPQEAEPLQKGAVVQLVPAGVGKNGKEKHNIVLMESPRLMPRPERPGKGIWTSDEKRAIAARVEQSAKLLRFCYDQAQIHFSGAIEDPTELRQIATTLFIQALRQY